MEVADKNLTSARSYTPQSFYKEFVGIDLNEFVCLYNDPSQEMNAHYRFHRARNIAGEDDMNFVNIEVSQMKEIAVKSVLANQAMWFAVNMSEDQSREHGMMEVDLYDYETLFDVKVGSLQSRAFPLWGRRLKSRHGSDRGGFERGQANEVVGGK